MEVPVANPPLLTLAEAKKQALRLKKRGQQLVDETLELAEFKCYILGVPEAQRPELKLIITFEKEGLARQLQIADPSYENLAKGILVHLVNKSSAWKELLTLGTRIAATLPHFNFTLMVITKESHMAAVNFCPRSTLDTKPSDRAHLTEKQFLRELGIATD